MYYKKLETLSSMILPAIPAIEQDNIWEDELACRLRSLHAGISSP